MNQIDPARLEEKVTHLCQQVKENKAELKELKLAYLRWSQNLQLIAIIIGSAAYSALISYMIFSN